MYSQQVNKKKVVAFSYSESHHTWPYGVRYPFQNVAPGIFLFFCTTHK